MQVSNSQTCPFSECRLKKAFFKINTCEDMKKYRYVFQNTDDIRQFLSHDPLGIK